MDIGPSGSKKTAVNITPMTLEIPPISKIDLTKVVALSIFECSCVTFFGKRNIGLSSVKGVYIRSHFDTCRN